MSADEAAQRLREDVDEVNALTCDWPYHCNDLRAVLDERDTLHARIRDREALAKVIHEHIFGAGFPRERTASHCADAVVAYLTSAPDDEATR